MSTTNEQSSRLPADVSPLSNYNFIEVDHYDYNKQKPLVKHFKRNPIQRLWVKISGANKLFAGLLKSGKTFIYIPGFEPETFLSINIMVDVLKRQYAIESTNTNMNNITETSTAELKGLKQFGFEAVDFDSVKSQLSSKVKGDQVEALWGIPMRSNKWADVFVGTLKGGKAFMSDDGEIKFHKSLASILSGIDESFEPTLVGGLVREGVITEELSEQLFAHLN